MDRVTFVHHSLSRGGLDFESEDVALVSMETRGHRPMLRGEQTHPLKRRAETGESSFLVVMPTVFFAHSQQHLRGEEKKDGSCCYSQNNLDRASNLRAAKHWAASNLLCEWVALVLR